MKPNRSNKPLAWVAAVVAAVLSICSCDKATVYDSYRHTFLEGWERNDTLCFDIRPVDFSGDYMEELGLRVSDEYPFVELCLVVEQTVIPSNMMRTDTLICNVTTPDGMPRGRGVNYFQHSLPLGNIRLAKGDSLHVTVRHNMRRENIRGVADVGLKVARAGYAR